MRVGIIDVGSNSTRLLIADVEGKEVNPLERGLKTTRLGSGIGEKRLGKESMEETTRVIEQFQNRAFDVGSETVVAAATSAVRDAENSSAFLSLVKQKTGLELKILSGKGESFYTYKGVLAGLEKEISENVVVVDLGGGSTEFIWQGNQEILWKSINAGAVRMTEGGHSSEEIRGVLKPALDEIWKSSFKELVGVGGTITNLSSISLGLTQYDPVQVHGYKLSREQVNRILSLIENTPLEERKSITGLQPSRADIIVAGTRILYIMMEYLDIEYIEVSEADILYGLALEASQNVEINIPCTYLL